MKKKKTGQSIIIDEQCNLQLFNKKKIHIKGVVVAISCFFSVHNLIDLGYGYHCVDDSNTYSRSFIRYFLCHLYTPARLLWNRDCDLVVLLTEHLVIVYTHLPDCSGTETVTWSSC